MISPGVSDQARLFLATGAGAVILWFLYDLLRLWRRLLPRGPVVTGVEDVVFFLGMAFLGFAWLYPHSQGRIRGYMVLAFVAGTAFYQLLFGRHFVRCAGNLICKLRSVAKMRIQKAKNKKESQNPIEK